LDWGLIAKIMIFAEILKRLDRAASNDERLHLDVSHVRALVSSPVYVSLVELKAKEFAALWHEENPGPPAPSVFSSVTTGSITEPTETTGTSAGTMPLPERGGGEARAYEEARRLALRKRRGRRSPGM